MSTDHGREALVLVAHADDETLGAGGTIRHLVNRGWDVHVVVVADALLTVRGSHQDNRPDCREACAVLGCREPVFLDFPDQRFDEHAIAEIANRVADLGRTPSLMISHADSDLNRDHRIVAEVSKIVARPIGRQVNLLACEIPNTSAWNGQPFRANYYVDIGETLETKIEAFSHYRNELRDFPHPWSPEGLRTLAGMRGMEAGVARAEAFQVVRMFGSF